MLQALADQLVSMNVTPGPSELETFEDTRRPITKAYFFVCVSNNTSSTDIRM